jgi:uncharacterized protein
MTQFIDTYAFIAWLNPNDDAHTKVADYLAGYRGKLITTDWVLMEVADALCKTKTRKIVVEFLQEIRSDPNYEIVPCGDERYQEGLNMFSSYLDKEWSLTDCISFGVMQARKLQHALTGDKHFNQAGFIAVFGS